MAHDARRLWKVRGHVGTPARAAILWSCVRRLTRPAPMERLLKAAACRRIPDTTIERVRKAYRAFEEVVQRHAGKGPKRGRGGLRVGGRAAFDALVGSVHPTAARGLNLANRRAAFRANSYESEFRRTWVHLRVDAAGDGQGEHSS